jgi:hypothetical protein
MFTHEFNVYETLSRLDNLLEDGNEEPSPMNRSEYVILTNKLVHGAVELLSHLAMHDVLAFETATSYVVISPRRITAATTDAGGGFPDEIAAIELPAHLVPYGAILAAINTWSVGTVETVADLGVLAGLLQRFLAAASGSVEESTIYAEWTRQATRVCPQILPALQKLDAAGLLRIVDLRIPSSYIPRTVSVSSDGTALEVSIVTESPKRPSPSRRRPAKKTHPRRSHQRKTSDA